MMPFAEHNRESPYPESTWDRWSLQASSKGSPSVGTYSPGASALHL